MAEQQDFDDRLLNIAQEMLDFTKISTQQLIEQYNTFARQPVSAATKQALAIIQTTLEERIKVINKRLREDPELIVVVENVLLAILSKTGVPA